MHTVIQVVLSALVRDSASSARLPMNGVNSRSSSGIARIGPPATPQAWNRLLYTFTSPFEQFAVITATVVGWRVTMTVTQLEYRGFDQVWRWYFQAQGLLTLGLDTSLR